MRSLIECFRVCVLHFVTSFPAGEFGREWVKCPTQELSSSTK
jgi:hypothetical protein